MTLQGLPTIRAYGMQRAILEKFYEFQNKHTQSWYLYIVSSRYALKFEFRYHFIIIISLAGGLEYVLI